MSLLSFHHVSLNLASKQILEHTNLQIQPQERIAIVGRNGAGKSTLLKVLQGQISPDAGQIQQQSHLTVAGLAQEVPQSQDLSVYACLVSGLGPIGEILTQYHLALKSRDDEKLASAQLLIDKHHAWEYLSKVDMMASRLRFDLNSTMAGLSGGVKRRVMLGAALVTEPQLLLLDEPTNHLDMESIEWLEAYLKNYTGSLVLVTHDREFLSKVSNRIIEVDRGKLHSFDCSYETYLDRREAMRLSEQKQSALFDKRLAEEEAWLRQGIKARRTRNEGRVRALKAMREAYQSRREELKKIGQVKLQSSSSGKQVIVAEDLCYDIEGKSILSHFSLRLMRGDKVGIVGPNGCGKTTLIRLLLNEIKPLSGTVEVGTGLNVAYFDQLRHSLDDKLTVMDNVSDGADFVTFNGKKMHVASYLKKFLFPSECFNQPVSILSGGERNRLMLAKLFACPVNLLVMDEPTNDLDLETLELLENILLDYTGTLLVVSHDRAFINHVVTSVLVYESPGIFNEYIGGYDDYLRVKSKKEEGSSAKPKADSKPNKPHKPKKLSFNEQRELSKLPKKISELEESISKRQQEMAGSVFYQQDKESIAQFTEQLQIDETTLSELYERWELLESMS